MDSDGASKAVPSTAGIVSNEVTPTASAEQRFPELRGGKIAQWATEVSALETSRMVFIYGAPTSGKSHVCSSLIRHLTRFRGASAHSIDVRDEEPLVRRMLNVVAGSAREPDVADIPVRLTKFRSRCVIHIANCHSLSEVNVNYLLSLLRELGARNWGRVQFLLEFRSPVANTAWGNLVVQAHQAFSGCHDIRIQPLSTDDVTKALATICLPGQAKDIAMALVAKAGLDPLSLDTVLQILLDRGAFRWVSHGGSMQLRVEDRSLFEQRLADLPSNLDVMLRERIATYEAHATSGERRRLPIVERLALLAAIGPEFDQERLARALRVTSIELHQMNKRLVEDKILMEVGAEGQVDFSHETMRLAAESYGREAGVLEGPAEWLLNVLDPSDARELIIAGTLKTWLANVSDAMVYFKDALKVAEERDDYPLRRAALKECVSAAEKLEAQEALVYTRDLIHWRIGLGWIEMQSGLQTQALAHYEEAERRTVGLLQAEAEATDEDLRTQLTRIRQRILTCLVDRQRVGACLTLLESLVPEITDETVLVDTLNRYLLLCVATGQAESGFDTARLGVGLANIIGAESQSVVLSDVGHLYLLESPRVAMTLWKESLECAQEPRQRTHAQANQLIGSLLSGRKHGGVTFEKLLQEVQAEIGAVIQLTRLYMYAGARAAISRKLDRALHYFNLACTNAMTHGQVSHEWEAENNLVVVYLALGKHKEAGRYLESAAERIPPLIAECDPQRIKHIYSMLGEKSAELYGLESQMFNNRVSALRKPQTTGTLWYLLYNAEKWEVLTGRSPIDSDLWQTKDHTAFDVASEIIARESNPLLVRTPSGAFTLALS